MRKQARAAKEARSHADRTRRGKAEWSDDEDAGPVDHALFTSEADAVLVEHRRGMTRAGLWVGALGLLSVPVHWLYPTLPSIVWLLPVIANLQPLLAVVGLRGLDRDAQFANPDAETTPTLLLAGLVAMALVGFVGHGIVFAMG